jgi:hypothetical protein
MDETAIVLENKKSIERADWRIATHLSDVILACAGLTCGSLVQLNLGPAGLPLPNRARQHKEERTLIDCHYQSAFRVSTVGKTASALVAEVERSCRNFCLVTTCYVTCCDCILIWVGWLVWTSYGPDSGSGGITNHNGVTTPSLAYYHQWLRAEV